jgi:hypothetical protein
MDLPSLGFRKVNNNTKHHILMDDYGIRYNYKRNSWHIIGSNKYIIPFYPKCEQDILDARRLFKK